MEMELVKMEFALQVLVKQVILFALQVQHIIHTQIEQVVQKVILVMNPLLMETLVLEQKDMIQMIMYVMIVQVK